MAYEMKQFASDPFDIMCSDCAVHEIEYWAKTTEDELRSIHEEELMIDKDVEDGTLIVDDWVATPESFEEWLQQAINNGYVRIA